MPDPIDRFLRHRPSIPSQAALGRVYGVVRQSWSLQADPAKTPPDRTVLASGRSASEAADIARSEAVALVQSGFHKPSGAWWGVEDGRFHRFLVAARPRRKTAIAVAVGVLGIAALALVRSRKSMDA